LHTNHIPGGIEYSLGVIFGYVVEDIRVHLLGKSESIWLARSSGMRLGTGSQWLDRTGRHSSRSFMDSMQWK
jgi:hypothetical protein